MGVKLPGILPVKIISWEDLKGKRIAIDASNMLYQFLSSIRQRDGTPLMDSNGNVTSHLSGTFYRISNLMQKGILPCVCFDGKPPSLKYEGLTGQPNVRYGGFKKLYFRMVRKQFLK